jgi:uncharacterized protein (TIGR03067 family)
MRPLTLLFVVLGAASAAPLPFPKPRGESDLERLQGEWVVVREKFGDEKRLYGWAVRFRADRVTFLVEGSVSTDWKFTLDRTRARRRITMRRDVGGGAVVELDYVYRVEGDTLYLAEGDSSYPSDLKGDKGDWLYVFKRKR